MPHQPENRNEAEENICNVKYEKTEEQLTDSTEKNTNQNAFNNRVTLRASDEQMMTIIKILFYIHKCDK